MLKLAAQRDTLDVVDDQHGQPTWSRALAERLAELGRAALAGRAPAGVYHGTATGRTTWFGLAREAYRLSGLDPERIRPTTSAAFARPAVRPAFSVLAHGRWAEAGLAPLRRGRACSPWLCASPVSPNWYQRPTDCASPACPRLSPPREPRPCARKAPPAVQLSILTSITGLLVLGYILELLRRQQLREKYAAIWLLIGLLVAPLGFFPDLLDSTAKRLGVASGASWCCSPASC